MEGVRDSKTSDKNVSGEMIFSGEEVEGRVVEMEGMEERLELYTLDPSPFITRGDNSEEETGVAKGEEGEGESGRESGEAEEASDLEGSLEKTEDPPPTLGDWFPAL
eukprot:CAMPEP_0174266458 /NCGR_PEP_ID=MMETSP0439-20130205/30302_1 /TAXON_ID=0 /ORGANISM="Stereomyxa ramosa, Strain Chinc5" /LENGTH=106 /DNA_ID=CAMNT_0015353439 /DNA_START=306 /DNA_END=626 /DNA_ORIENTATION=-